jgi:4a-hydroxytetrahydrobiopterin dehydratase
LRRNITAGPRSTKLDRVRIPCPPASIPAASDRLQGRGMDKPKILTAKELRAIMPRLSGWKLADNKLSRTFEFQDFVQSLSFINSLVAYFETVDHHPDVRIAYGEVTFELTRYDVGGRVTDKDVEVAKKISSVYRARS